MKRLAWLLCALGLLGCGRSPDPSPTQASGPILSTVTPSAATLAKLAQADRLDGTEDKVITLCASCGLRMAGKETFACRIGEYTLHSCAARCRQHVLEDPDEVFREIELPDR